MHAKKINIKAHIRTSTCLRRPTLDRQNGSDQMASASAPASKLAVQRPAPASSLAVPPPAASTTEAVDLSAGAVILEDPALAGTRTRVQILPCTRYCICVSA